MEKVWQRCTRKIKILQVEDNICTAATLSFYRKKCTENHKNVYKNVHKTYKKLPFVVIKHVQKCVFNVEIEENILLDVCSYKRK